MAGLRIEHYELELYRASVMFMESFTSDVTLQSLEILHHIYVLREEHEDLSPLQLDDLNFEIEALSVDHPSAAREYRLLSLLVSLSSALMVKWGLLDLRLYQYRQTAYTVKTQMVDLMVMSEDVFTLETLWLAAMVQCPPLSPLLDESVRQFAIVLQQEACKLFTSLCQADEGDKETLVMLEGMLAGGEEEKAGAEGRQLPEYVRLRAPGKCVPFCCWGRDGHTILRLRAQLQDFELVYRSFEQALIGALLDKASAPR